MKDGQGIPREKRKNVMMPMESRFQAVVTNYEAFSKIAKYFSVHTKRCIKWL